MKNINIIFYVALLSCAQLFANTFDDRKNDFKSAAANIFGDNYDRFNQKDLNNDVKVKNFLITLANIKLLTKNSSIFLGKEDSTLNKAAQDAEKIGADLIRIAKGLFVTKTRGGFQSLDRAATGYQRQIEGHQRALASQTYFVQDKRDARKLLDSTLLILREILIWVAGQAKNDADRLL